MVHRAGPNFWKTYDTLTPVIQSRADKQFLLLKSDPSHPSLQLKCVGESHGYELWSARINLNYRALAWKRHDVFLWTWIGDHTSYNARIK